MSSTDKLETDASERELLPEERELEKKRAELAPLEDKLAQFELDAATLRAELQDFEALYVGIVGRLYAELDGLEAEIAEEEAALFPDDEEAQQRAAEARSRADESEEAANSVSWQGCNRKFNPPPDLKKKYRALARLIHPDLTTDCEERERRHMTMAQVNRAYEDGDEGVLSTLLDEWKLSPEAVKGDDIGAELVRLIRQIAQAEKRIATLDKEINEMRSSDFYRLKLKVEEEQRAGNDLLQQMAERASTQITRARRRLKHAREVRESSAPAVQSAPLVES